jgi:hypothetical protein
MNEREDMKKVKEYAEVIDKLSQAFRAASENGLFGQHGVDVSVANIMDPLQAARENLESNNFIQCESSLNLAETTYHRAINAASRGWRFVNVYAFHLWIYFIGMLFSIFLFYITIISPSSIFYGFQLLPIQAVIWGMIGGLFQDIWYLYRIVPKGYYRNTWMIQYFSAPFIGGILGAIVYIIIIAGLVVLDTDTEGKPRDFVVMALAAFAGYNWDWAIKRFESIGDRF